MESKKQLPTKYRTKKTTEADVKAIEQIRDELGCGFLEAKHNYFSAIEDGAIVANAISGADEAPKAKRSTLKVSDLKIGVTLVVKPADFKALGIKPDMTAKEANALLRKKLGVSQ